MQESVDISPNHPRYYSLLTRERLVEAMREGVVTPSGLISHGRGEAFDYLIGEHTAPEAEAAERAAAAHMLRAENPVICVNGNAAALAGIELLRLAELLSAKVEVNLFHRQPGRMERVVSHLKSLGADEILGLSPDARISGIASERAHCCSDGIYSADVVLVPIEDGDRAEALASMGKVVIAIDLNPLSRTSRAASVSIVDEAVRAIKGIMEHVEELRGNSELIEKIIQEYDNESVLQGMRRRICLSLEEA